MEEVIFPQEMPPRPRDLIIEPSSQLWRRMWSRLTDEIIATKDCTNAMEKRKGMFHTGGVLGATARSYPMVISVPSFSKVMSISISTGMWKKGGHSVVSMNSGSCCQSLGMYSLGR